MKRLEGTHVSSDPGGAAGAGGEMADRRGRRFELCLVTLKWEGFDGNNDLFMAVIGRKEEHSRVDLKV